MLKKINRQFWKYSNFFLENCQANYVANMLFKHINLFLRTVLEKCEEKKLPTANEKLFSGCFRLLWVEFCICLLFGFTWCFN